MPKAIVAKTAKDKGSNIIHLKDPERCQRIRAVFASRKQGALTMAMMVRFAFDEWLQNNEAK